MGVPTAVYYSVAIQSIKRCVFILCQWLHIIKQSAFPDHIVLNVENIEVAVVQNNKTKIEHLFNLTLQAPVHSVIYLHAYFSFLKQLAFEFSFVTHAIHK